ncbi:MAG: hypothetical protein CM1200mP2_29310 [Planctomycetaceae bacterium]|nr:MAG: hypothetical protein CM1200mP2_29310 [Planctomycetaceae bacterium]
MVRMCSDNRQGDNRLRSRVIASPGGPTCWPDMPKAITPSIVVRPCTCRPGRRSRSERPGCWTGKSPRPGGGWCDLGDDGCLEILHFGERLLQFDDRQLTVSID